uniref:Uncharacterized protein n=1 Tax=Opuntia streptacantha TaxID=393608 RepID=A0A7C8ZX19_OPUST
MCSAKDWMQSPPPTYCHVQHKAQPPRRHKVRVHRLIVSRKRHEEGKTGGNMKLQNLKLYLENRSILEENEKLRQKALHLMQENQALLSEFQRKFQFSLVQGTKNSIN